MKKETINTFEGGMIKDLHPLTTPNNVLTDALNATTITYNGNENILLNDMGNVKIKHALLKSGYVPVGMKEHGGIIYVAAYNPHTKKGQVGSFPSPQLLWEGDPRWTVNTPPTNIQNVSLADSDFYTDSGTFGGLMIHTETVKKELYTTANGEARIFHPGDRFVIGFDRVSNITDAIGTGKLEVQLGVIKSDGSIEVMRTWNLNNVDLFLYSGSDVGAKLNDVQTVQVFDASSSGQMIIIFNLITLDSFSIIKKYSLGQNDNIVVTFTGEAQKDGNTLLSTDDSNALRLTKSAINGTTATSSDQQSIVVLGTTGKLNFMIYPNVPFGIIQRMGRPMSVDFDKIRKNEDDFGEWRFFVTEDYVKIGWSYDFYNLDETKEIEYIRMYFHKLEDGYTTENKESIPHIDFLKESYNGNFEDYITYSDIGISYKNIYIVEVVKKLKGDSEQEEPIVFRMLYLSKLYNDQYNGFFKNTSIGLLEGQSPEDNETTLFQRKSNFPIGIDLSYELSTEVNNSKAKIKHPGEANLGTEVNTSSVRSYMYSNDMSLETFDALLESLKQYLTQVHSQYNGTVKLKGELQDIKDNIIGIPKPGLLNLVMNLYSLLSVTVEDNKEWKATTPHVDFPTLSNSEDLDASVNDNWTKTVANNVVTTSGITIDLYRLILGLMSDLLSLTYTVNGLLPLLSPSYDGDRKWKIAPYWKQSATHCIAGEGDDDDTFWYNSLVTMDGGVALGPDAGGGCDDGGLWTANHCMGDPMTNIMTGVHGEYAEITFDMLQRNDTDMDFPSHDTENGGHIIDYQDDNFMLACWKFTDNTLRPVNLGSARNAWNPDWRANLLKATFKWPRLDVRLRCILSQIFLVNKIDKVFTYVVPNEDYYRYQEGDTKVKVQFLKASINSNLLGLLNDIMVSESDNNKTLNQIFTDNWTGNWGDANWTLEQRNKYQITNLIPSVILTPPTPEEVTLDMSNGFNLDVLLSNYMGVSYTLNEEDLEQYEIGAIYGIDTTNASAAAACTKSGELKPDIDGTYNWKETPPCVKITGDLKIFRWNDQSIVNFPGFASYTTTTAREQVWDEVPEGEINEVLIKTDVPSTSGNWTNAVDTNAPDMNYTVLYSPQISPLQNLRWSWNPWG